MLPVVAVCAGPLPPLLLEAGLEPQQRGALARQRQLNEKIGTAYLEGLAQVRKSAAGLVLQLMVWLKKAHSYLACLPRMYFLDEQPPAGQGWMIS